MHQDPALGCLEKKISRDVPVTFEKTGWGCALDPYGEKRNPPFLWLVFGPLFENITQTYPGKFFSIGLFVWGAQMIPRSE